MITLFNKFNAIAIILLSLALPHIVHSESYEIDTNYTKLIDKCSINLDIVPRATYKLSEFDSIIETREGLEDIANVNFNCDVDASSNKISPVKLRILIYATRLGESPIADFVSIHNSMRVFGEADIHGDGKLYVRHNNETTSLDHESIKLSLDNQAYTRVKEKDMKDRVNDEYGTDFLDSGGLLPDDTYIYKACLFGHYQSDKYDHTVIEDYALTCEKKEIVYVNPTVQEIVLNQVIDPIPGSPTTFSWQGVDQVRPDVNYYYTLKLWKKDVDQDIEEVVSGITYCPNLDVVEISNRTQFIYPTDVPECNGTPLVKGDYVWQVFVSDETGRPIGDNIKSTISTFEVTSGFEELVLNEPADNSMLDYTNELKFSWGDIRADSYNLYISDDPTNLERDNLTSDYLVQDNITDTFLTLNKDEISEFIQPNKPIYWFVQAEYNDGDTIVSDIFSLFMEVEEVIAEYNQNTQIFSWNTIPIASEYHLYVSQSEDSLFNNAPIIPDTNRYQLNSFEIEEMNLVIIPNTPYFYAVIPVDDNQNSLFEEVAIQQFEFEQEFEEPRVEIRSMSPPYSLILTWDYLIRLQESFKDNVAYKIQATRDGSFEDLLNFDEIIDDNEILIDNTKFSLVPEVPYQFKIQPLYNDAPWGEPFITEDIQFDAPNSPVLDYEVSALFPPKVSFKITPPSWAIGGYVFIMKNLTTDEETEIINDDTSLRQFDFDDFNFPELKNDNTYEFSLIPIDENKNKFIASSVSLEFEIDAIPEIDIESKEFLRSESLFISWSKNNNISFDEYEISISDDAECSNKIINDVISQTQYTMNDLSTLPLEKYYFCVHPLFDQVKVGSLSIAEIKIITDIVPEDQRITELQGPEDNANLDTMDFILSWLDVVGDNKYTLQVSESRSFDTILFEKDNLDDVTFDAEKIKGLSMNKRYFWRVFANKNDTSSTIFSFKIDSFGPSIEEVSTDLNQIRLEWTSLGEDVSYKVQFSENDSFSKIFHEDTVSSREIAYNSSSFGDIFIRVIGVKNGLNYGEFSEVVSESIDEMKKPEIIKPDDGIIIDLEKTLFSFEGTNASSYTILFSQTDDFSSIIETIKTDKTEVSLDASKFESLADKNLFYWQVIDEFNQKSAIGEFQITTEKIALIEFKKLEINKKRVSYNWETKANLSEASLYLLISEDGNIPVEIENLDDLSKTMLIEKIESNSGDYDGEDLTYDTEYFIKIIALNEVGKTVASSEIKTLYINKYIATNDDIKQFQSIIEEIHQVPPDYKLIEIKLDGNTLIDIDLNTILEKISKDDIKEFNK